MTNFFSVDGKSHKIGSILADILLIGLLWTVFSIPIITAGATTTALYYVCTKRVSGKGGYIFSDFLRSFKDNFFKSTIIFLILTLLSYVVWLNFQLLDLVDVGVLYLPIITALFFVFMQIIAIATNVFCILARFDTTIFQAMKSALFMAYRHILLVFTNLFLLLIITIAAFLFPVLIIFMMGIYIYFSSFLFIKMFTRYYSDFDATLKKL